MSMSEFLSTTTKVVDWIVSGLLARGCMTNLHGLPKIGKTSLVIALCAAILRGLPFLGLETKSCGILYGSEESSSFRTAVERGGLLETDLNLRIVPLAKVLDLDWEAIVALLASECHLLSNPGLIIIDTLPRFARLKTANAENDAAVMTEIYRPEQTLLNQNLAVLNILHARKSDGECRGSNASQASCDVVLGLHRLPGNQQNKNLRLLKGFESRFSEVTPEELVFERKDNLFVARGTSTAVAQTDVTEWLRENLAATEAEAQTIEQLLKAGEERLSYATLYRVLHGPGVEKTGSGKRGDPVRYFKNGAWRIKVAGKGLLI
jgi:predicted ATP-dependent serine protease